MEQEKKKQKRKLKEKNPRHQKDFERLIEKASRYNPKGRKTSS